MYLTRARECTKYTLPFLIRQHEGITKSDMVKTPWQALGARGVKNISAKMLLLLLPPNDPFFKLQPDSMALDALPDGEDGKKQKTQIEKGLAKVERSVQEDVEASADRVIVDEALKHLVVAGNGLLHDTDYGLRFYHLDRYVCVRDPESNVIEIVALEMVSPSALDAQTLAAISQSAEYQAAFAKDRDSVERHLHIYTHVKLEGATWTEYQECYGVEIPDTRASYPKEKCPWIVLRWSHLDGEDYGRSYIEEILGDLKSLETLWKAVVEGAVAAARIIGLVTPNSTTNMKTLNDAANGDFVEGNRADVDFLQLEKYADFQIAYKAIEALTERLSFSFMLNTAIQRNAERVTAEEIRYMAGELEDALGGAYAILSQEFQLPYVRARMARLQRAGTIPPLPEGLVRPTIVTGLQALGRGHDRNKLMQFISDITSTVGPETAIAVLNVSELIERLGISEGVNTDGLLKTAEQMAQEKQQSQMQQMMQMFGPEALKQMGGITQAGMKQNPPGGNPQSG